MAMVRSGAGRIAGALALVLAAAGGAGAADAPAVAEGDVVVRDVRFADGEALPELRLHYEALGTPRRDASGAVVNAVMLLHGTTGTGRQFLAPADMRELFAPGKPLDASRFYVILPDGIGAGGSSKPSDGLKARFPRYGSTATRSRRSAGSSRRASGSTISPWCSAPPWAACRPGCGPSATRT